MLLISSMRGRDKDNPKFRGKSNGNFAQTLEVREDQSVTNTITTVQKDNLVLELKARKLIPNVIIGGMQEHQSIKTDGICTTLTSSMGTGGGYVPMVVEVANDKPVLVFKGGCDLTTDRPELMNIQSCMAARYDAGIVRHRKEHTGVIEVLSISKDDQSLKTKPEVSIGTTHFPHGWLGLNADFSGVMPTIDASIHYWHTLLIEVKEC